MHAFVVAIEYRSEVIPARGTASPVAACEHPYDLGTAHLAAHLGQALRTSFPAHIRGWAAPEQAPRCPDCTAAVDQIITDMITEAAPPQAARTIRRDPRRRALTQTAVAPTCRRVHC